VQIDFQHVALLVNCPTVLVCLGRFQHDRFAAKRADGSERLSTHYRNLRAHQPSVNWGFPDTPPFGDDANVLKLVHHKQGPIPSPNGINALFEVPAQTLTTLQLPQHPHTTAIGQSWNQFPTAGAQRLPIDKWRSESMSVMAI
jgi:hypothetical protein